MGKPMHCPCDEVHHRIEIAWGKKHPCSGSEMLDFGNNDLSLLEFRPGSNDNKTS